VCRPQAVSLAFSVVMSIILGLQLRRQPIRRSHVKLLWRRVLGLLSARHVHAVGLSSLSSALILLRYRNEIKLRLAALQQAQVPAPRRLYDAVVIKAAMGFGTLASAAKRANATVVGTSQQVVGKVASTVGRAHAHVRSAVEVRVSVYM
jgi:hypothetical protein